MESLSKGLVGEIFFVEEYEIRGMGRKRSDVYREDTVTCDWTNKDREWDMHGVLSSLQSHK